MAPLDHLWQPTPEAARATYPLLVDGRGSVPSEDADDPHRCAGVLGSLARPRARGSSRETQMRRRFRRAAPPSEGGVDGVAQGGRQNVGTSLSGAAGTNFTSGDTDRPMGRAGTRAANSGDCANTNSDRVGTPRPLPSRPRDCTRAAHGSRQADKRAFRARHGRMPAPPAARCTPEGIATRHRIRPRRQPQLPKAPPMIAPAAGSRRSDRFEPKIAPITPPIAAPASALVR